MKVLLCLLGFLAVATFPVRGQTTNYIVESHKSAMLVNLYFEEEVEYWRMWLTIEAYDMGFFFTDLIAQAAALAQNPTHGAGIASCAAVAHFDSTININYLDRAILLVEKDGRALHSSVFELLRGVNIKEADLELFYYQHNYVVQEFYDRLWEEHFDNLFYSWLVVLLDFYYVYDELFYCLDDVLFG